MGSIRKKKAPSIGAPGGPSEGFRGSPLEKDSQRINLSVGALEEPTEICSRVLRISPGPRGSQAFHPL